MNTGLAIANPNSQPVSFSFYFTDANGTNTAQLSTSIPANSQIAAFLNEKPFNSTPTFQGTFTFVASAPVAVIALRGYSNELGNFLITTLPVADLSVVAGSETVLFPHFADGAGWTTQFVLVNTGSDPASGTLVFPSAVTLDGQTASIFTYNIPARTSRRFASAGLGSTTQGGSVRIIPGGGTRTPTGVAIFSSRNPQGFVVSEAGVPALGTATAFRMYSEYRGNFIGSAANSMQTGVAVANSSAAAAVVNFELTTLAGTSLGLTGSFEVPANSQVARFLHEIPGFTALPNPFQGVVRMSTTATGVSMIGLRARYNENKDFLMTTTQPTIESAPPATGELFFPHIADGDGYTTQFILFNGSADQASSGSVRLIGQRGDALGLSVR